MRAKLQSLWRIGEEEATTKKDCRGPQWVLCTTLVGGSSCVPVGTAVVSGIEVLSRICEWRVETVSLVGERVGHGKYNV